METTQLVDKIWKFCDTLRDDGVTYGDYLEQITYLLFLKWQMNIHLPKNQKLQYSKRV